LNSFIFHSLQATLTHCLIHTLKVSIYSSIFHVTESNASLIVRERERDSSNERNRAKSNNYSLARQLYSLLSKEQRASKSV